MTPAPEAPVSVAAESEAVASLFVRLAQYQRERFPLTAYVPMIAIAATAGVGWSRAARGAQGSMSGAAWSVAALTMLVGFFLLRVADEHKDAALDRVARPELPVPRGLVTLAELRRVGAGLALVVAALNLSLAPRLLWVLAVVAAWAALMTKEFFVAEWLRVRHGLYLLSHMVIMPLLLGYATTLDWLVARAAPPRGLGVFLAATYVNGLVLEIGRKLREPAAERARVETYSATWGLPRAQRRWLGALVLAAALTAWAMSVAGMSSTLVFPLTAAVALIVAWPMPALARGRAGSGKATERMSAVWNLLAYLFLALPWALTALRA